MESLTIQDSRRIAFFLKYIGGGGGEKAMIKLASGIAGRGHKVDFVLGKVWGTHVEKIPPEIQIVDLDTSNSPSALITLTQYLKQKQPAALFSAMHYSNEIAIIAKHLAQVQTKVVAVEQNTLSFSIQKTSKTRRFLIPRLVRALYPIADSAIAVSQGVAEDLIHNIGLAPSTIQTIYNPVLTPELLNKAKEPAEHPWFREGEPPVILGVGKLETQKDFPTLIKAFAEVRETRPARLMILGWGPDRPKLEAMIQALGLGKDVALPGYVDNPHAYMARSAVFVLSSAWEGLPTVLIEAMAARVPVVSTDCRSGPDEILDHGKYGFMIPIGDSKAMAEAVLTVLAGETKVVDEAWLKQFTLNEIVKKYLELVGI